MPDDTVSEPDVFSREFMQVWRQEQIQCEVQTIERGLYSGERCPEPARFVITHHPSDRVFKVCGRCMGTQVANCIYYDGHSVTVERLR